MEGRYTLRSLASSRPTVIGATQSIRVRRYTGRGGDGSQISLTSTAPKRDSSSSGARARVRHRCCRCACGLVKGGASFVDGITAPQPPLRHRINDHRCLVRAPNARFTETGHLQCVRPVLATDLGAARHLEDLTAREVFVDYEAGGLGYWRLFDGLSVLQTSPRVKMFMTRNLTWLLRILFCQVLVEMANSTYPPPISPSPSSRLISSSSKETRLCRKLVLLHTSSSSDERQIIRSSQATTSSGDRPKLVLPKFNACGIVFFFPHLEHIVKIVHLITHACQV